MTFSFPSIRNFSFQGVTSTVLPLSHCQLLIEQSCAHRGVSFSWFCPFQSDRLSPDLAGTQPAFGFVSLQKLAMLLKELNHETPHFTLGDFTNSEPSHHHKNFQSAWLESALHIFWGVLSPRLWFCSSSSFYYFLEAFQRSFLPRSGFEGRNRDFWQETQLITA